MSKVKFGTILLNEGMVRGPFGSDMKKSLFVPEREDAVKVITQENVFEEEQLLGSYYISNEYYQKMKRFEVLDNDFLVTCDGTLGRIMFVDKPYRKTVINSSLLIIRLDPKKIDYDYFYYYWKYYLCDVITKRNVNSCLKHLPSLDVIKNEEIDIPEINVQRSISNMLKTYDDKIKVNKKLISTLFAEMKDTYAYKYINTNDKKSVNLQSIATIKTGKRDANYMVPNGKYKFYTCSEDEYRCNSFQFSGKNVLVAGNGSLYVKAVNEEFDAYQRTYVIKPNDDLYFGVLYLACNESLKSLRTKSSGSIVKFIKIKMLQDIEVNLLDDSTMLHLNDDLELMLNLKKENEKLDSLRTNFAKGFIAKDIVL